MRREFEGVVIKYKLDSNNRTYTVIEVKNKANLNYRVFLPGKEFSLEERVAVIIETKRPKQLNEKEKAIANT